MAGCSTQIRKAFQMKIEMLVYILLVLLCGVCVIFDMKTHYLTAPFLIYWSNQIGSSGSSAILSAITGDKPELTINSSIHKNVVLGVGQDELNILRLNGISQSIRSLQLTSLTQHQLALTCHLYLDNANVICQKKLRMGNSGQGGWEICDDPEVRPEPPCIIYVFGNSNDFSFDDAVSKWYKCHVYSFDQTIAQKSHNRSDLVHFYDIGISGYPSKDKYQQFLTMKQMRTHLGHQMSQINIIKLDVDVYEWDTLLNMIHTNQLDRVHQLFVMFHISSPKRELLLKYMLVLQMLENRGFRIFYSNKIDACSYTLENKLPTLCRCFQVCYRKQ